MYDSIANTDYGEIILGEWRKLYNNELNKKPVDNVLHSNGNS